MLLPVAASRHVMRLLTLFGADQIMDLFV